MTLDRFCLSRKYLSLFILTVVLGCGSATSLPPAPTPIAPPAPSFPNVTGNWQFEVNIPLPVPPALPTNPIVDLSGSLSSSGGIVTGILHAQPLFFPHCIASTVDLPATGTVDIVGNLTLTAPLSGGIATIVFNVTPGTRPVFKGTYQVLGGPCAQPSLPLTVLSVPNISGIFTGVLTQHSLTSTDIATITATATLVQAVAPNSDGQYPLTGTITTTGACSGTVTFTDGIVSGNSIQADIRQTLFGPLYGFQAGITSTIPLPSLFTLLSEIPGCAPGSFVGALNRQ